MDDRLIQVRPHRGSIVDSLKAATEVHDRLELWDLILATVELPPMLIRAGAGALQITPYGYDSRTRWDTYLITIPGYGVWGFANGDVP